MGSSLGRFSGTSTNMNKLIIASLLAFATALPIEDTADVAAAKAEFNAAFAPVNADAQAAQIAAEYIADAEEVAAAKADFNAAFAAAEAGDLAALQAAAPVHEIPAPAPLAAAPVVAYAGYPYAGHAYAGLHGLAYGGYAAGLSYAGLHAGLPYAGLPAGYAGLPYGLSYAGLPVVAPAKAE